MKVLSTVVVASIFVLAMSCASLSLAVNRSWDGGGSNDTWGNTSNWSPNGDPGGDDLTIGDLTPGVFTQTNVNTNFNIDSLSVINGASVDTDGNRLVVSGLASFDDANTKLRLRETTSGFSGLLTENLFIGSGAEAELYENAELAIGNGAITNFGRIDGSGGIRLLSNPATPTSLFTNTGTLAVGPVGFLLPVPERTLEITAVSNNARVDLDGNGSGIVLVGTNATLDLDVQLLEPFSGTMNLAGGSTLDVEDAWQLDGDLNVNNSSFNTVGDNRIVGGLLALDTGAVVTLSDADDVLRLEAPLLAGAGTIANSGTVIFDAPAQIAAGADFQMNGNAASLVVNSDVSIASEFNLDGSGTPTNQVIINESGRLTVEELSSEGIPGSIGHVADNHLTINGGHMIVDGHPITFDGVLTMHSTPTAPASLDLLGANDPTRYYFVGDGVSNGGGQLNVTGSGVSTITLTEHPNGGFQLLTFQSDSATQIEAGATLEINGDMTVYAGAVIEGAGTLRMGRLVTDRATSGATINVETIDLDHEVTTSQRQHIISRELTINANAIDESDNGFEGFILIEHDANNNSDGRLTMNVPGGWRFNSGIITLDQVTGSVPTMLSGDRMTIGTDATLVVDGGSIFVRAPLTIQGTVELPNSNHRLNLLPTAPSRIEGGLITGLGTFSPIDQPLSGFGTIATRIDNANAELAADDGTLSITGGLFDIGALRATNDGVLNITDAWNTNIVEDTIILEGGELTGAQITVSSATPLTGNGLVTARVINNGIIRAEGGGTLILDPATGSNNYFNSTSGVSLDANSGNLLLRNPNGTVSTDGQVRIGAGQEIAVEGFRINYDTSARMSLNSGTYRSQDFFIFNGDMIVSGSSPSRLVVESTITTTLWPSAELTLNADLEIDVPTFAITDGVTATGSGSLIVLEDSRLFLQDAVDLEVAVENRGFISPGTSNFDNAGGASLAGFQQESTGELQIDLAGVAPGFIDLLTVDNNALLDGTLSVNLIDGFEPILGNNITILETTFGNVGGTFSMLDFPTFNGLTFDVVYNSQSVVLQVVELSDVDLDNDGDVDGADFLTLQRDNPSLISDWQTEYGSETSLATSQGVPEPGSWLLVVTGLAALANRRCASRS